LTLRNYRCSHLDEQVADIEVPAQPSLAT
jgi:hypothetical protein